MAEEEEYCILYLSCTYVGVLLAVMLLIVFFMIAVTIPLCEPRAWVQQLPVAIFRPWFLSKALRRCSISSGTMCGGRKGKCK
jgi:hypothetical protein